MENYFVNLQSMLERGEFKAVRAELTALEKRDPLLAPTLWGMYHVHRQEFTDAEKYFLRAIELSPSSATAYYRLATLYQIQNQPDNAVKYFALAVKFAPENDEILAAYGNYLFELGDYQNAQQCGETLVKIAPQKTAGYLLLGLCCRNDFATAIKYYEAAEKLDPKIFAPTSYLKAVAYQLGGRMFLAEKFYRHSITLDPNLTANYQNLATVLIAQAKINEGINYLWETINRHPADYQAYSNLLLASQYRETNRATLATMARDFAKLYTSNIPRFTKYHQRKKDAPIRVGFVSADFRQHSVAFFIEPLLQNYDREKFAFYAYFVNRTVDEITPRLKNYFTVWHDILATSDQQLCALIRHDKIDVLIDLSGHTNDHRLLALAQKPAPIQMTWLGYPDTTGLTAIDYRISDHIADPPEFAEFSTEKILALDGGFHCFSPLPNAPAIGEAPQLKNGYVTFASFNNYAKVSDLTIELWAKILTAIPQSKLLIKALSLNHEETKNAVLARFAPFNIAPEQLILMPQTLSFTDHLATYNQVDIALDTFPYNGTTTTFEALWMGVPTLTLSGETHASRVGASILTHTNLTDLIANNPDDYVRRAIALVNDIAYRQKFRATIREHLLTTTVFDAKHFTTKFTNAIATIK